MSNNRNPFGRPTKSTKSKFEPPLKTIEELELWYDEDYCLKRIKENWINIQYCKVQTAEIGIEAVKQNKWSAITYIDVKRFPEVYAYYKLLYS